MPATKNRMDCGQHFLWKM